MQMAADRLDIVLQDAGAALDGSAGTLAQAADLTGAATALRARVGRRRGLAAARQGWAGVMANMGQTRGRFRHAAARRKSRLRRRIASLHLLRIWRAVRWWLFGLLLVAAVLSLIAYYWSSIVQTVSALLSPPVVGPPSVQPPDFIGPPAPPATPRPAAGGAP